MSVCSYTFICLYLFIYLFIIMSTFSLIYQSLFIHTHTHTHTHTHIYIYIYIYIYFQTENIFLGTLIEEFTKLCFDWPHVAYRNYSRIHFYISSALITCIHTCACVWNRYTELNSNHYLSALKIRIQNHRLYLKSKTDKCRVDAIKDEVGVVSGPPTSASP